MLANVVGWAEAVARLSHALFVYKSTPSKALRILFPLEDRNIPDVLTRYLGNGCDPCGKVEPRPVRVGDGVKWGTGITVAGISPFRLYPVLAYDVEAMTLTTVDDAGDTAVVLTTSGLQILAEAFK